jgi:DNA invertase Pin-like site-specific DNA recombinase
MLHVILVIVAIVCQLVLMLVAMSGIKFYTLNSQVETASTDATRLKLITLGAFALACLSVAAILIF